MAEYNGEAMNRFYVDGCWSFESATIVTRVKVGVWEPPPYSSSRAQKCLSCYKPEGYVMLSLEDVRVK